MSLIWKQGASWDAPSSPDIQLQWEPIASNMKGLVDFSFKRKAVNSQVPNKLVVFCDASKQAYGAVVYAVDQSQTSLVFAKSKVAPIKKGPHSPYLRAAICCLRSEYCGGGFADGLPRKDTECDPGC